MQVVKQMNADILCPGFAPRLSCFQGDSGRAVELKLFQDGAPWEPEDGTEAMIRYQNARGEGGTYDTLPSGESAYEILEHGVRVCLTGQVCAVAGLTRVQVVLLGAGAQVTVAEFQLEVAPTATGEAPGTFVNLSQWLLQNDMIPKKGEDYWTAADIAEIQSYIDTQLGVIENGTY